MAEGLLQVRALLVAKRWGHPLPAGVLLAGYGTKQNLAVLRASQPSQPSRVLNQVPARAPYFSRLGCNQGQLVVTSRRSRALMADDEVDAAVSPFPSLDIERVALMPAPSASHPSAGANDRR